MRAQIIGRAAFVVVSVSLLITTISCDNLESNGYELPIAGSGTVQTREVNYSDFSRIVVESGFQVDFEKGEQYAVSITLDDNLFEHLDISKDGNLLSIRLNPDHSYVDTTQKAVVTLPSLEALTLSDASLGHVKDFDSLNAVRFDLSDASRLDLDNIRADELNITMSDISQVAGDIDVNKVSFTLSGASILLLTGSAGEVSIVASGASHALLEGLEIINASVTLSEESSATIEARGELDADLSSGSKLYYLDDPKLNDIKISGLSHMHKLSKA